MSHEYSILYQIYARGLALCAILHFLIRVMDSLMDYEILHVSPLRCGPGPKRLARVSCACPTTADLRQGAPRR